MFEPSTAQRVRLFSVLIAIVIAVLYLSFLTKLYYWDGITFAQSIEDAQRLNLSLIHPNHLLYNPAGYLFYRLLVSLGMNVRAVMALQILNALLGAIVSLLLFIVLKRSLRTVYVATCLTLLFAFAATWWKFSTDADSYIVSVLFMVLGFLLVRDSRPRPLLVSLTFIASISFHELAVFFGIVLAIGLALQAQTKHERRSALLTFALISAVGSCLIYIGSFYLITGKLAPVAFFKWVTNHSPDSAFTFNPITNLEYVLRGHARLFFGGRFNLLKGLMSPAIVGLIVLLCITTLVFLYSILRGIRDLSAVRFSIKGWTKDRRELLLLSVVWISLYEVFLFFWLPQNTFYRLFYLPALILLVGLFIPELTTRKYRLALFVAIIGLANFLFLIYPYTHVEKYPPLQFAHEMDDKWRAGTLVLYALENSDESLVRYFTPKTAWQKVDTSKLDQLDQLLSDANARGKTVWLETTAIDNLSTSASGKSWLDAHSLSQSQSEINNSAFRIRFVQMLPTK